MTVTRPAPEGAASHPVDDAAFFERVVNATRDGILVGRAIRSIGGEIVDFEMIFINEVLQDMLDPGGDWVGRTTRTYLPNTIHDGRHQLLVDAIETGEPQSAELPITFRNGGDRWLSIAAIPRGDEVVVSVEDVTDQHDALDRLAESEQRYRELVEHQAELVCRFEPDTTILFANEAFARYYGHDPDELVGKRMIDLLPEARREPAAAAIGSLTPQRPTITDEGFLVTPDGTQRWQQWTTSAVVEDGEISEIQAVGIDITDRKRAEIAIQTRSEILALVTTLSLRFIDLPSEEFDCGIGEALGDLGRSLRVDRTYLVLYRPDRVHFDMTHEWCREGVPSVRDFVRGMADTGSPRMRELLHEGEPVCIESVADLGPGWEAERALYEQTGVRSTIVAPIIDGGVLLGTVGFDVIESDRPIAEHDVAAVRSAAGVFGQIMARRDAETEMRQSEQRFRALVAGVPDLLVRVSADGRVLDWRPPRDGQAVEAPEAVGRPVADVFPELAPLVERVRRGGRDGITEEAAIDVQTAAGTVSYDTRVTLAGHEVIAVVRDVTAQRELQMSLLHQATHDELTGLANRRLFSERLDAALERGRSGSGFPAVLFIDLDRFKVLNDSQGHEVGDAVLREAATRIERSVRPGDVVARLGGDEFAVLVHRVSSVGDAVSLAERIVKVTSEQILVDDDALVMTASVGVVLGDADSSTASMLRDADAAMYEAKARGRQRVEVFTAAIHEAALARHQVEHDLRRALEVDELELHYQPLWSLTESRWVGAEALVRWNHPVRGLLPPAEFLNVADDSGLMPALGAWVLDRACRDASSWLDLGADLRVWVNLSADQLTSRTLVSDVVDALEAYGVVSGSVGVEVTETALVGDVARARSNLDRLRALGVAVALDDFGTGLSSLTHLDSLPLDVVKLDGAFVAGASERGRQHDLIDGIVRLLRRLGVEVLAERVEGPDELEALRALGVDTVQGYHLGRPMPVAALRAFLEIPVAQRST